MELISALGGQLAMEHDGAVTVSRPDGAAVTVLDGSDSEAGGGRKATYPTWSNDGTLLAWAAGAPGGGLDRDVVVQAFDEQGLPDENFTTSPAPGPPVFYLQWNADDDRLAALRSAEELGRVQLALVGIGDALTPVGQAGPFFVSWSPSDPSTLVANLGEGQLWRFEEGEGRLLGESFGGFSAPDWADDQHVVVVREGLLGLMNVDLGAEGDQAVGGRFQPIVAVATPIRFVVSPDGSRVAYQALVDDPGVQSVSFTGPGQGFEPNGRSLSVLDLRSGEITVVATDGATAWEWSPDGGKLAWLAPARGSGTGVQWSFWSDEAGSISTPSTPPFRLTDRMAGSYLPFFAQYAQAITGWSPDSSAYAYTARAGSENQVLIQLVDDPALPLVIGSADMVTWGTGPTPPVPAGGESPA